MLVNSLCFLRARPRSALATLALCAAASAQTTWVQLAPAQALPPRAAMASAYDPVSGKVVVFGGFAASGYLAETWTFDGQTWTRVSTPTSPPARAAARMAYDDVTHQLVLFGGFNGHRYLGDTWLWDGATSRWTGIEPTVRPPAVTGPNMFTDPLTGHADVYGGYDGRFYQLRTFQWTGSNWRELHTKNVPSARSSAVISLDPRHHNVVMFGGLAQVNPTNTWTFDGVDWQQQFPAVQPLLRYDSAAAFDPHLGGVVVFGGGSGGAELNDTWLWDGTAWQELFPPTQPSARESFAFAYDRALGHIVVAGGQDRGDPVGGTWWLAVSN